MMATGSERGGRVGEARGETVTQTVRYIEPNGKVGEGRRMGPGVNLGDRPME